METDSSGAIAYWRALMSYTANNQLYFAFTPTASVSTWNVNWNWYDARGMRIISHVASTSSATALRPDMGGTRHYFFYDGSDVALSLAHSGLGWSVEARYLSGGVDHQLLGRFSNLVGATRNLAPVGDFEGSTFLAVRADGTNEYQGAFGRDAFGRMLFGAALPPDALFSVTGYTGASTPHADGGFTYLRNRWYDPQTGRFLTQDPIGLAGGVNLYAYAGNDPIGFSDPFGLDPCTLSNRSDCPIIKVSAAAGLLPQSATIKAPVVGKASFSFGPTLALIGSFEVGTGGVKATGGLSGGVEANLEMENGLVKGKIGGECKITTNNSGGCSGDASVQKGSGALGVGDEGDINAKVGPVTGTVQVHPINALTVLIGNLIDGIKGYLDVKKYVRDNVGSP